MYDAVVFPDLFFFFFYCALVGERGHCCCRSCTPWGGFRVFSYLKRSDSRQRDEKIILFITCFFFVFL